MSKLIKPGITWPDGSTNLSIPRSTNDFRLTLTSGDPAPSADAYNMGVIYLTPYIGNAICLPDSSGAFHARISGEVSLTLSSVSTSVVYDIFAYWTGSAVALELSAGWAGWDTRTDTIAFVKGIAVKSSDHTRRLVGSFLASGTNTANDGLATRWLCNYDNAVQKRMVSWPAYSNDNFNYQTNVINTSGYAEIYSGQCTMWFMSHAKHCNIFFVNFSVGNITGATRVAIGDDSMSVGTNGSYMFDNKQNGTIFYAQTKAPGAHFVTITQYGWGTIYFENDRNGGATDPHGTYGEGLVWV